MTLFKLMEHLVLDNKQVIEVWHDGVFVGEIIGTETPGIKIISKYTKNTYGIDNWTLGVTIGPLRT